MAYRLFIDDERFPADADQDMVIVRSSREAIDYMTAHGMPDFIQFDHDLADDDRAVDVVDWITDRVLDGDLVFPDGFSYDVHSRNPIGAENIRGKMDGILRHAASDHPSIA
jgi:hypothetical protein